MARNRDLSEKKIISAVHSLLLEKGFSAVGINSIADKAGLNKVLIYRYFGDLEGLLEAYVRQMDPFPGIIGKIREKMTLLERDRKIPENTLDIIVGLFLDELYENRDFRELLKWELSGNNTLNQSLAGIREESGLLLSEFLKEYINWKSDTDIEAAVSLITGGLFYLIMRADTVDIFNGIPIASEEGRTRLKKAAVLLASALY